MGFLAPAVPWIVKGGAALGSMLLSKHAAKGAQTAAMTRSPEEQTALTGAQTSAGQLAQTGSSIAKSGQEALAGPTSYWSKLLGGNRAAMSQATAGARGSVSDIYSGAERGLEKSGVRGAQRDVAKAELGRDRAGKIAGLTTGVQPAAAQELSQIGGQEMGIGNAAMGTSGSIFANLLGQGSQNRQYGRQEGEKAGSSIGSFLFDAIRGIAGSRWPGANKGITAGIFGGATHEGH